jgi:GT2 family glycosyltransferase
VIADCIADVAVLIVGFRNPSDIKSCLIALSGGSKSPSFDVFICENGGPSAYAQLLQELLEPQGPCRGIDEAATSPAFGSDRFTKVRRLRLQQGTSDVWLGCAVGNLGYAGGINAWLDKIRSIPGWKGVWILNPDTEPQPGALAALVERAESGRKGMVGSTIIDIETPDRVRCRGGLHWQQLTARTIAIGLGEPLNAPHDLLAIERAIDSPSGASMYVTRSCLQTIGNMDEKYFLFFEDLDWGQRAKVCGLGYASASIVGHRRGTTTGSAGKPAAISRLSVYLQHRNGIHFVRTYFPWALPLRIATSCLYAIKFLLGASPGNCRAAMLGILAGLRGEIGPPKRYVSDFEPRA